MTITSGLGVSTSENLLDAVQEAATTARAGCATPSAVLMLATFNHGGDELLAASAALAKAFPGAKVAGGTVSGLVHGDRRYDAFMGTGRAVAVLALGGPGVRVSAVLAAAPTSEENALEIGRHLAQEARKELAMTPAGGMIFTPGFSAQPPLPDGRILQGLQAAEPSLRVSGTGLAGGVDGSGNALPGWGFVGDRIERLGVLLITFGGELRSGFGVANGLRFDASVGKVTDVSGFALKKLNGHPAKEVVLDSISGGNSELRATIEKNPLVACVEQKVSLAVRDPNGDFCWCHPLMAFLPDGGLVDVFEPAAGQELVVARTSDPDCMAAAEAAAHMLVEQTGSANFEVVVSFSCVMRGLILGTEVAREDAVMKKHAASRHHLGIIANGEIGTYRGGRSMATGWAYSLFGLAN